MVDFPYFVVYSLKSLEKIVFVWVKPESITGVKGRLGKRILNGDYDEV